MLFPDLPDKCFFSFKITEDKKVPKVIWQSHIPKQARAIIPILTGDLPEATWLFVKYCGCECQPALSARLALSHQL